MMDDILIQLAVGLALCVGVYILCRAYDRPLPPADRLTPREFQQQIDIHLNRAKRLGITCNSPIDHLNLFIEAIDNPRVANAVWNRLTAYRGVSHVPHTSTRESR